MSVPLAARLRPTTLDDFIGQKHLVGEGKPLRVASELGVISSMIFWGPPGVGKTTLARILAQHTGHPFVELSAVSAGKADIRALVEETKAQKQLTESYASPVLFLDEIHRFNKSQQDFLLPHVEDGTLILIGATTENPSFEVISPLLSRARVYVLQSLSDTEMEEVTGRALQLLEKEATGMPKKTTELSSSKKSQSARAHSHSSSLALDQEAREWLLRFAGGDARSLITLLEHTYQLYHNLELASLKNALQSQHLLYDKKGEEHYNTISSYVKSMRASNPDAALYYLARMVEAGEDPKFIARRMVIFASEDIGLAQPTALVVANAVFEAVQNVGYPEAQINLAHGTAYLALAKKDRSAYDAYFAALADVKKFGNLPIPLKLCNAPTKLMKDMGYGKGYEMYPDPKESLLPEKLKKKKYL